MISTPSSSISDHIGNIVLQAFRDRSMPACSYEHLSTLCTLRIHSTGFLKCRKRLQIESHLLGTRGGFTTFLHAREEITKAYLSQHAMDMANFLSARAEEVVPGGIMTIVVPARPNGTPHDQVIFNMMFDLLGSCLMELSKNVRYIHIPTKRL